MISESPYIGSLLKNKIQTEKTYRFFTCKGYLIFYAVTKDKVIIVRVIYGKRNYAQILFKTEVDMESDF